MVKTLLIVILGGVSLTAIAAAIWLLTRPAVPKPYTDEYHAALSRFTGSVASMDAGIEHFGSVYSNLAADGVSDAVRELYADTIYFNDTIKTFRDREELADYMGSMSKMLERSKVEIEQVIRDDEDVFVRWSMHFETRAAGRDVHSRSIGMTHLRFDETGQIILHQDFWDPATGIYRHMPVLGYLLSQADQRMSH